MERENIQSIILYAHGHLPCAAYLLLQFGGMKEAKSWIRDILPEITHANRKKEEDAVHLALTYEGVGRLYPDEALKQSFPRPFRNGMIGTHKSKMLGDVDESDPQNWEWGNEGNPEIHALLMLYARDEARLQKDIDRHTKLFSTKGISLIKRLDTEPALHKEAKEHFGFRDGLGQPSIRGVGKQSFEDNSIALGEFVLGYPNEYDKYPEGPVVKKEQDPKQLLPFDPKNPSQKSLGKNGTFLIFRQLSQHVPDFWGCMKEQAEISQREGFSTDAETIASKAVGRWPDGAPLAKFPDKEQPRSGDYNHFGYAQNDAEGLRCPIGSHLRRANPRDAFTDDPEDSIKFVKKNRIIRRGRGYGKPVSETFNLQELQASQEDGVDRGLQFICVNTSISRQFELVQQQWLNNPKFLGLYQEVDPITGFRPRMAGMNFQNFTIPHKPLRLKLEGLQRFVTTKGGAYFFLPGIQALRFLSSEHQNAI